MDLLEKEGGKTRKLEKEDVTGKVALIMGASSGLGRVFSVTLADRGCNVVIAARRVQLLKTLCDDFNALAPAYSSTLDTGEKGASGCSMRRAAIGSTRCKCRGKCDPRC